MHQRYKNLIIGVFFSNILISQTAVSDETISDFYLGEKWVHQIQTSLQNNYRLENGGLLLGNQNYQAISFSGYRFMG